MYRSLLVAGGLLLGAGHAAAQTTVSIDPLAAYLHTDTADLANAATPIGLAGLGLAPGYTIKLETVGDWDNGPAADEITTMLAVFSGSGSLLAPSLLHRVPDAIDAGTDVLACCTWPGNEPMDISEDFAFDPLGVTLVIPPGATHLFVSTRDNYYRDNSDPDGDLGVRITLVSTTDVPAAQLRHGLSARPSPFALETSIGFEMRDAAPMRLAIHDVTGRLVRVLLAGHMPAGPYAVRWDGCDASGRRAPTGSYLAVLDDGTRRETVRLMLVR